MQRRFHRAGANDDGFDFAVGDEAGEFVGVDYAMEEEVLKGEIRRKAGFDVGDRPREGEGDPTRAAAEGGGGGEDRRAELACAPANDEDVPAVKFVRVP